ncbi:thermonuclease family protein [Simiduia curdlanivorans]|uniref:Thermonuclease family protein n=1 Tax=Simiduia curdlanivorans TaxID=1492769 RepID=A0ABV8V2V0_9GAMM|nr:thermonuclease family protein [Simiduia curdlanivorans]MDN3637300.1 thermonuclease family protein [Simiduia curdlanivorans]
MQVRLLLGTLLLAGEALASEVWPSCFAPDIVKGLEPVEVARVYDGDTVQLVDGRKVRLLNINTPELDHKGGVDQAYAREATEQARQWLNSRDRLFLVFDREHQDRYGRWLAHLLDGKGQSLAEHLLIKGLAVPLAVPPNLAHAACYFNLASEPKAGKVGVWAANQAIAARHLSRAGFQRVSGKVSKITKTRAGDYWLELDGVLAIQIKKHDLEYFDDFPAGFDVANQIEVEGWVVDRSNTSDHLQKGYTPWKLQVRTPYALRVN